MNWEYSLAGLLVGGFVGLTGMGGGSLVAPLLIVVFGVPALPAVGSGLLFAAVTQSVGGWQHARLQAVDRRTVALLALGSIPASVGASWLFSRMVGASAVVEGWITSVLGLVLLAAGLLLLLRPWISARQAEATTRRAPRWLLTLGGGVIGALAGITSVGSGSLSTALLTTATREKGQRVVGTVLSHAMLLTLAAGLTHLAVGAVDLRLTAVLLLGSVPGVILGSRLTSFIPEVQLRGTLAVALVVLSFAILLPGDPLGGAARAAGVERVAPEPGAGTPERRGEESGRAVDPERPDDALTAAI